MIASTHILRRTFAASLLFSGLALSGCSLAPSGPVTMQIAGLQGKVHGGQQPVGGATIQLYTVSTAGYYGGVSTPLIPTTVLSNPDGSFSITGKYPSYTCEPGDYLYIVATGGNPGIAGTQNNSALALMTGLGPCAGVTSSSFISINELTTVASVWALGTFINSTTNVTTSPTNVAGLGQAFAAINKLVNTTTGTISGPALPTGATLPIAEINTLADILATCVNTVDSGSPSTQSSACQTLFTGVGVSAPLDTITAAIILSHSPGRGLSLYSSASGTGAPFQPTLSAVPTDWTIAINYIGGGLNAPKGIAVDQAGSVWIANSGNNSVTKLDNTGAALSPANGFTAGAMNAPAAIAIDLNGNAWVANSGNSTVTQLSSGGTTGTSFGGGGLNVPRSIAIDGIGNVWVGNFGNSSVTQLSSSGIPVSVSGYMTGGVSQPVAIAIDSQ
jgi:hypothetical protein